MAQSLDFRRREDRPNESEVLNAICNLSISHEYWQEMGTLEIAEGFEEQLRTALITGGFFRVPLFQLTQGIGEFPEFRESALGNAFPDKRVDSKAAGTNGFLAVHRAHPSVFSCISNTLTTSSPTRLHFGFVGSFTQGRLYFREPEGSNIYTVLADAHYSWPHCIRPGCTPPSSPFLYFRP